MVPVVIEMALKDHIFRLLASRYCIIYDLFCSAGRNNLCFIVFHGVHNAEMVNAAPPPSSSVSLESFQSNIMALTRRYVVISQDEALAMLLHKAPWRKHCAVITFDDSLACLARLAAPWLAARNIPATFFVSTEAIDRQKPYWWLRLEYAQWRSQPAKADVQMPAGNRLVLDSKRPESLAQLKAVLRKTPAPARDEIVSQIESQLGACLDGGIHEYPFAELMTWDDVRSFANRGMIVGSHSVSHPNLALLPPQELADEMAISRQRIEQETGKPCRHVCFPYGAHSPETCLAAERAGYDSAVTTIAPGWNSRASYRFALQRFSGPREPYKLPYLISGIQQTWQHFRTNE